MSSYYTKVDGTLQTGKTAQPSDIHLIQAGVDEMIRTVIIDMFGDAFILGEDENAFKLYATNLHVDQTNLNYDKDGTYWISFYDRYFRQPIEITKSSIDTIRVEMINDTNITTTVYAELRDENFELIKEANALLKPTPGDDSQQVDFHFNEQHLPVGLYYFVIRPVDISATDLAPENNDSYTYTTSNSKIQAMPLSYSQNIDLTTVVDTIIPEHFCIKYDAQGNYNHGLEASLDGATYLQSQFLEEGIGIPRENDAEDDITQYNPDLYFEEIFSSGNTYLVDEECVAIIQGERVSPVDTHITIEAPSNEGNRIDVVSLNKNGEFIVTQGTIFTDNEEKIYPVSPAGNLDIAYITNFRASTSQESKYKVPAIEQDDTTNIIRQRDILERIRRLEKYAAYQKQNNDPLRVIYNCTVDPILSNNGVDDDASIRGEGTYNMGTTKIGDDMIVQNSSMINYAWSIIKNNYTYNVETQTTENGKIDVWDIYTTPKKESTYEANTPGLYNYYAKVTDHSETEAKPVPNLQVRIQIKKGGTTKLDKQYTTNKDGIIKFTLFSLKLATGTYTVYTIYGTHKLKTKLTVAKKDNLKHKNEHKDMQVSLPKVGNTSVTHSLPEGVFAGNDSFYTDNVEVDTTKGEVRIKKISNLEDNYEINEGRALLKDTKKYTPSERVYSIKQPKNTSTFPAINVVFDREVYIKSITPYISGFKNITSFGILIFKNDVIKKTVNSRKEYKNAKKKTYNKTIGAGKVDKDKKDDTKFPTLYKSKYVSLKDLVKKSGNYQVLKKQVTFDDVNLDLEAGTYTIMICPKLKSGAKTGEIKIKQYHTKDNAIVYGMNTNIYGSSKLAKVRFDNLHVYDESWDIAIKHKTYKYYDKGILISKPVNTGVNVAACTITKNFKIPKNCEIKLYVSNNGGTTWDIAKSNYVKFKSSSSSFRWKLEMTSNSISTPKLKFNSTRQNAISFSLATDISYLEYEDYRQCYETPLLNANYITRAQTKSTTENTFTAWEFARVFMEDEELNSKIDILISYAHDDYSTSVHTDKSKWNKNIFFSTVFADLTLNDFKQESIDYDNYDGNVEYDEYNYPFSLNSKDIMHYTGGLALASPNAASLQEPDIGTYYGNINAPEGSNMNDYFVYEYVGTDKSPYVYYDNNDNDVTLRARGMHISGGPYVKATYQKHDDITTNYTSDDAIIGIRFNNGLDIDDNITHLTIGLIAHAAERTGDESNVIIVSEDKTEEDSETPTTTTTEKKEFPAGTFKIAISLGKNGEIDPDNAGAGKEFIINQALTSDQYTEVTVDFIDDLPGYKESGISSIAIKAVDPSKNPLRLRADENDQISDSDFIGIGRVVTSSYNMRPYVPLMYSGNYSRLKWQNIIADKDYRDKAAAFAMYSLGRLNESTTSSLKVFYPIDYEKDIMDHRLITSNTEKIDGTPINRQLNGDNILRVWGTSGTNRRRGWSAHHYYPWGQSERNSYIERQGTKITTHLYKGKNSKGNNEWYTYMTEDSGNQILFNLPAGATGKLFKIVTNIPYTIYDLIDIEYYVFTEYWKDVDGSNHGKPDTTKIDTEGNYNIVQRDNGYVYKTDGAFSKGDLYIDFYNNEEATGEPIESFPLPAWGRIATKSYANNKIVHAWFKKRSSQTTVKSIVLRRENPRQKSVDNIKLMLNDIIFLNAEEEAALGPQMQIRIYPNNTTNMVNTKIRKIGGIYRL